MIDIYLDCASLEGIREGVKNPLVKGVTTNPSLMRAAGVTDYEAFAKDALQIIEGLPISLEVFADEWDEMERQARLLASWGSNVNVKIPVMNTKGESAAPLVRKLSDAGVVCNVTAVFTPKQMNEILATVNRNDPIIISVFCGRINDTGGQFVGSELAPVSKNAKLLWASCRQVLSIYDAKEREFDIITVTPELLKKYESYKGKDLMEFSLETVSMFHNDAQKAGYKL